MFSFFDIHLLYIRIKITIITITIIARNPTRKNLRELHSTEFLGIVKAVVLSV